MRARFPGRARRVVLAILFGAWVAIAAPAFAQAQEIDCRDCEQQIQALKEAKKRAADIEAEIRKTQDRIGELHQKQAKLELTDREKSQLAGLKALVPKLQARRKEAEALIKQREKELADCLVVYCPTGKPATPPPKPGAAPPKAKTCPECEEYADDLARAEKKLAREQRDLDELAREAAPYQEKLLAGKLTAAEQAKAKKLLEEVKRQERDVQERADNVKVARARLRWCERAYCSPPAGETSPPGGTQPAVCPACKDEVRRVDEALRELDVANSELRGLSYSANSGVSYEEYQAQRTKLEAEVAKRRAKVIEAQEALERCEHTKCQPKAGPGGTTPGGGKVPSGGELPGAGSAPEGSGVPGGGKPASGGKPSAPPGGEVIPPKIDLLDDFEGNPPADSPAPEAPAPQGLEQVDSDRPVVTGCSAVVLDDSNFCVCGRFPPGSEAGLRVNGQPLAPYLVATTPSRLDLTLPAEFPAGAVEISADEMSDFEIVDGARGLLIHVHGQIDRERLRRGQSTTLKLELEGTEAPLELRLWNENPAIVRLEGGDDQSVRSSGGSPNRVTRTVHAVSPGDFTLHYSLAVDPCPCAGEGSRARLPGEEGD